MKVGGTPNPYTSKLYPPEWFIFKVKGNTQSLGKTLDFAEFFRWRVQFLAIQNLYY